MYTVPAGGPWWPAVGAPLERGVRPHSAHRVLDHRMPRRDRLYPSS